MFKGHSYVPSTVLAEILGGSGIDILLHDDIATKGSEGCMVVASWSIEMFPCESSRFQC